MRLLSLHLRGAIGIQRGLGLDEISIDFTQFDPGLVAFVAPNGRGKSTSLENLQPFRQLVSRDGALARHFGLKDSRRDLRFEMNGHEYRSLLLIDGVRGNQEAYLYRDGEPVTDGKTGTYDAAVRELIGSEDMFFRSLFQAQQRESITSLTAGRRKALFVELLGLDHLAGYHEAAKDRAGALLTTITEMRASVDAYREQAARFDELDREQAGVDTALSETEAEIETARSALSLSENHLGEATERLRAAETLEAEIERLIGENNRAAVDSHTANERARTAVSHAAGSVGDAEARIATSEKILANAGLVREKCARLAAVRESLEAEIVAGGERARTEQRLREAQDALRAAQDALAAWTRTDERLKREADRLADADLAEYQRKLDRLDAEIAEAGRAAALTTEVPCTGTDLQGACKLLASAVASRDRLATLNEDRLDHINAGAGIAPDTADAWDAYCEHQKEMPHSDLAPLEARVNEIRQELAALPIGDATDMRAEIALLTREGWEGLLGRLDGEEERLAEYRRTLESWRASLETAQREATQTEAEHSARVEKARNALQAAFDQRNEAAMALDRSRVHTLRLDIERLKTQIADAQSRVISLTSRRGALSAQIVQARAAASRVADVENGLAPRIREHDEWALLARATGKDGLQALELDAAGPGVSEIANHLLADTFGSQFQIAFDTTRVSADGKKQIESFEIRVYSDGTEQTIENLSGGQRVWIEAAISQAIAIYLRRKSGLDLRTSFLDEADGALDADNAHRYLSMLRASHALAGIHHTLLITHRQELLALIPQQIHLVPGEGIAIQN